MILTPELKEQLLADGYFHLKEVDGKICGLMRFAFTVGLMVNITLDEVFGTSLSEYEYRFCYPYEKAEECLLDLKVYKYGEDPIGGWVKQKGSGIDRVNPAIEDEWLNNRK
jgi:hypothetical protein